MVVVVHEGRAPGTSRRVCVRVFFVVVCACVSCGLSVHVLVFFV